MVNLRLIRIWVEPGSEPGAAIFLVYRLQLVIIETERVAYDLELLS